MTASAVSASLIFKLFSKEGSRIIIPSVFASDLGPDQSQTLRKHANYITPLSFFKQDMPFIKLVFSVILCHGVRSHDAACLVNIPFVSTI